MSKRQRVAEGAKARAEIAPYGARFMALDPRSDDNWRQIQRSDRLFEKFDAKTPRLNERNRAGVKQRRDEAGKPGPAAKVDPRRVGFDVEEQLR